MTRTLTAAAIVSLGLSFPAAAQQQAAPAPAAPQSGADEVPIIGRNGDRIGTLSLRGGDNAVVLRIAVEPGGLAPGWHGVHLHAVGDCSDAAAGFKKSGGHINPEEAKHGFLNADGPEAGDLPNLYVAADGSAHAEMADDALTLTGPDGVRDQDGSALVIHAEPDDHKSQPIGGAGDRVACAAIK